MKAYDVIVIGGGAAGLSAALSASRQGASAAVLEASSRVGRKILASGNGRCNLANTGEMNYPGGGALARQVLGKCPPEEVLAFFRSLGLVTAEEEGGRVYPGCGQAAAVLDVLRGEIARRGVPVLCDTPALRLEIAQTGLRVHTKTEVFSARAVICACGGMAGGKLGHDGGAYRLLTGLGHTLVSPRPALSPLIAEKDAVKGLSGLRLPAILTLCRKASGKPQPLTRPSQGEALFTDYGVSGVCAMELARRAGQEKNETGAWPVLYMDFAPMLGLCPRHYGWAEADADPFRHVKAAEALLEARRHMLPEEELLRGLTPRILADRLRGLRVPALARQLTAFPVPLIGVRGFAYAQVTAGGVACAEFAGETLMSRLVPGLYAAGEMLDVDGACGGFNLQFAFASGLIAGASAARFARADS